MTYIAANLKAENHCFFDADGGVSGGKYTSLNTNLSSQDNRQNIQRNFEIIAARFGKKTTDMATIRQSVSNKAIFVTRPTWFQVAADGLVTTEKSLLLGIKTADCAPVLLADEKHGVIGAAHAGWRGACQGIVENVVTLMLEHGAERKDIAAAIGPCLQQPSFAVQNDMRQELLAKAATNAQYFTPDGDGTHFYFDLSGYVEDRLRRLGIENIENSRIDTYPPQNGYFSYRRNTHLNLISAPKDYPTQYSCIQLQE